MNTYRIAILVLLSAGWSTGSVRAQLAVAVAADPARSVQWFKEDRYWSSVIGSGNTMVENTGQLVRSTNELLARLGTTSNAVSGASATIPTSTQTLKNAVELESRQKTLSSATQRYSLNQVPLEDKNNQQYAVLATYDAFGQQQKRNNTRYASFAAQQAMNDRFQTAAENAEKVEAEELNVQAKAVDRLKSATTQAEIEVCTLAVEASKGRLDLAHAKMNQARAEMDEYLTKVNIEKERKAESDREWAEGIASGLRARALKAYRGDTAADDNPKS